MDGAGEGRVTRASKRRRVSPPHLSAPSIVIPATTAPRPQPALPQQSHADSADELGDDIAADTTPRPSRRDVSMSRVTSIQVHSSAQQRLQEERQPSYSPISSRQSVQLRQDGSRQPSYSPVSSQRSILHDEGDEQQEVDEESRQPSYSPVSLAHSTDELDRILPNGQPSVLEEEEKLQDDEAENVSLVQQSRSRSRSESVEMNGVRHDRIPNGHAHPVLDDAMEDVRILSPPTPEYSNISSPVRSPALAASPPPPPIVEKSIKPAVFVPYRLNQTLSGHKRGVASVRFSPDGKKIASCSADATIRIWDADNGQHLETLEGHLAGVSTIAWARDSQTLASGSDDKTIRFWNTSTGKQYPHPLHGHANYIYSIAFSPPSSNILVSGSYDEAIIIWDVRTRRALRTLPAHSDPVGGIDFVHDGTLIVSCSTDGLIRIWDTASGQCLRTLVHEDNAGVASVKFSPNGRFILAWTLDNSVRLWNYIEGRCVKTYQGHVNCDFSLSGAFGVYTSDPSPTLSHPALASASDSISPAEDASESENESESRAYITSGSDNGTIIFWDVITKEVLAEIKNAHDGVVLAVDTRPVTTTTTTTFSDSIDRNVKLDESMTAEKNRESMKSGEGNVQNKRTTKLASCGGSASDRTVKIWELDL